MVESLLKVTLAFAFCITMTEAQQIECCSYAVSHSSKNHQNPTETQEMNRECVQNVQRGTAFARMSWAGGHDEKAMVRLIQKIVCR